MTRTLVVCAAAALTFTTGIYAQDGKPADAPPVATVLGKPVTAEDLQPSKKTLAIIQKDTKRKSAEQRLLDYRVGALRAAIMGPLGGRYVKDNHLEATEREIASFSRFIGGGDSKERMKNSWPKEDARRTMRARSEQLREELKSADLSKSDRKEMEEELANNARLQDLSDAEAAKEWEKMSKEATQELAPPLIQDWKMKRALFKKYGGRVMFQQAGLEPFDATRKWLEEQEQAGDFAIHDAALREQFWSYWKRDGPFINENPTGREFDKPFWEMAPGR